MSQSHASHDRESKTACPRCGRTDTWGYFPTRYCLIHRCVACRYYMDNPLPTFQKAIVYLDQFVISNMVKAKDPYWAVLAERLDKLMGNQLLACPYSPIHRRESMLFFDLSDALQEMYKRLGGSDRFRKPEEIQEAQLVRGIRQYLAPGSEQQGSDGWKGALDENPHLYTGDMVVNVIMTHHPFITESVRQEKERLFNGLQGVCDYRRQHPATFQEDLDSEFVGFADVSMELYRKAAGSAAYDRRRPPFLSAPVLLVHRLAAEVQEIRPQEPDPITVVDTFLHSSDVRTTPCLDISCRLWATIAQKERSPKGPRSPKASDSYDVDMISHYAPFCDAMFVDNEFRGMATEGQVGVTQRYGVKLFSEKKDGRDEFLEYLDTISASATDNHWDKVAACDPRFGALLAKARELKKQVQGGMKGQENGQ